jgi:hypothetical protein
MTLSTMWFFGRYVRGWPEPADPHERATWKDDDRAGLADMARILTHRFECDAHFAAYAADIERRHTIRLFQVPEHSDKIERANLRMVLAVFDVDDPIAHKEGLPSTDKWKLEEQPKLQALIDEHPGGFVYTTRGGYRLVYALPEPFPIRRQAHDDAWTAQYKSWIRYLRRRFKVEADGACADWTRFYRAPFVMRDGVAQQPDTFGDPSALGVWAPKLTTGDRVEPKPIDAPDYGTIEPVPIADPSNEYGLSRLSSAVRYLESAPLSIRGQTGRNTMFSVCAYLVRRLRLPLEIAADCIEVIYNPRLAAAGTSTWSRDVPGPHKMTIIERLEKARDTGNIPAGHVMTEAAWSDLQSLRSRKTA